VKCKSNIYIVKLGLPEGRMGLPDVWGLGVTGFSTPHLPPPLWVKNTKNKPKNVMKER
jgi:hypothetical protein